MNESDEIAALFLLDSRRCAAVNANDGPALEQTMWEDYVHVHATGEIDDRAGFVAGILSNPRVVERGGITVRLYGDVAILIGEQTNHRNEAAMTGVLQLIAAKRGSVWRFVSAQMTRKS